MKINRYRWNEYVAPAILLAFALVLTIVLVRPGTHAVKRGGASAELYVIRDGHRVVLDRITDAQMRQPRLVALKFDPMYGPSGGGGPAIFGVTYTRWWAYGPGTAVAHYDQQLLMNWYLTVVQVHGAAQYLSGCYARGIVPGACSPTNRGTVQFNMTRDTRNVMWQWNFIGYQTVELNNTLTGPWIEQWIGVIHAMGDGTMWWDAYGVKA